MEQIKITDMKLEGGWLMVKPDREDMGKAMAVVRTKKDKPYSVEIKEFRQKRSLDSNSYAWVLIGKLAEAMRIKPIDVYRTAIKDLGGNYTPVCLPEKEIPRFIQMWQHNGLGWLCDDIGENTVKGCHTILAYHGSSCFNSKTMARFIDNLVQDCKALGIETLSPERLEAMKEEWH